MSGEARSSFVYDVDHLATFTVGSKTGVQFAEDGLRKLRLMEDRTGIWTMRCQLLMDETNLIVLDKQTGEEVERFPWHHIADPTAIVSKDQNELFNNIALFTVHEDRARPGSFSEMHIFQALSGPAREMIEDIKIAQLGRLTGGRGGYQTAERPYSAASTEYRRAVPPAAPYAPRDSYPPAPRESGRLASRYREHDYFQAAPDGPSYSRASRY